MIEHETQQRIKEVFANQRCNKCQKEAERYYRSFYYCKECFPIQHKRVEVKVCTNHMSK